MMHSKKNDCIGGKWIILSDIHGNLSALLACLEDIERKYEPDSVIILGDVINYGMRPNEVIEKLSSLEWPIPIKIYGNHEKALFDHDTSHFSTERGRQLLEFTRNRLNADSVSFLQSMNPSAKAELELNGKRMLFVHGNIHDPYWGNLNEASVSDPAYLQYDYVLSGHSHIPHLIEYFHPADRPEYRNKKRTVFINPGSVGQPRNHSDRAQYVYLEPETETIHFNSIAYDIAQEQVLYPPELDSFYRDRLSRGI